MEENRAMKTNAMRILESLSIPYTVHTYEWDEEHLDAIHAAASAGLDTERVYKTIVMMNSNKDSIGLERWLGKCVFYNQVPQSFPGHETFGGKP